MCTYVPLVKLSCLECEIQRLQPLWSSVSLVQQELELKADLDHGEKQMESEFTVELHLQEVEREISFRTECGLYYSYYKQMIQAASIQQGIVNCKVSFAADCL